MVILFKLVQSLNAYLAIVVTLPGITTLYTLLLFANAYSPIQVTVLPSISAGMFTVLSLPLYFVIVTVLSSFTSYLKE